MGSVTAKEVQGYRWWHGLRNERFWLESTDRSDIGADLKAPLADDSDRPSWRYGLFRDAALGDIVFHYDKKVGAIASVSRIAGAAEEAPIVWAARGTYARERGAVPVEVPGYRIPLADHRMLAEPVTLEELRAARTTLGLLYDAIPSTGARYFPFELSSRPVRPLQGYAFKLPASFVGAFAGLRTALDGLGLEPRTEMDIFRDAVRAVEAAAPRHPIGGLQALRARHKGLRRIAGSIFGNRAIDHGWVFHWGGREELQFNLGLDSFADGSAAFRAGAAFSFEPSRSLPDIEVLVPKVARFNAYLRENLEAFADLAMWHWQDGVRSDDYPVVPIADRLIRQQTFVFLGERQPLDRIDPETALRTLDRLYPLYRWVEGMEATDQSPSGSSAAIRDPAADALALDSGRMIDGGRWIRATSRERTLDIYLRHLEMQRRLADELRREGANSVLLEASLGNRSIDAVARFGEDLLFYEVKTALTARACLREAIGQLLEYALWPGSTCPSRLVVVGEAPLDSDAQTYLAALNARFPVPIAYRSLPLVP
jgi:hypothetical protein